MVTKDGKEFLEVSFHNPRVLTAARTQGRYGNGNGIEYTEEYFIEYWRPGFNKWVRWRNRRGMDVSTPFRDYPHVLTILSVLKRRAFSIASEICKELKNAINWAYWSPPDSVYVYRECTLSSSRQLRTVNSSLRRRLGTRSLAKQFIFMRLYIYVAIDHKCDSDSG